MGGANSSDVKLSDYYRNGTYRGDLSALPQQGKPNKEKKFSDF